MAWNAQNEARNASFNPRLIRAGSDIAPLFELGGWRSFLETRPEVTHDER